MRPRPGPYGVSGAFGGSESRDGRGELGGFQQRMEALADELGLDALQRRFALELARLVSPDAPDAAVAEIFLRLVKSEAEGGSALLLDKGGGLPERLRSTEGLLAISELPEGLVVGFSRYHQAESRIARRVLKLVAEPVRLAVEGRHLARDLGGGRSLSDEQAEAVMRAAQGGFSLISGGPGTGKTSIVVAILRTLASAGLAPDAIALAAPTGKAANRMDESVRRALQSLEGQRAAFWETLPPARTLHRLLGFSPETERFRHDEWYPLSCQVCIVDESSMVDVALFDKLLAALPRGAALVLLGDADQLPSVEVGAVFRELAAAPMLAGAVARLTTSFRMNPEERGAGRNVYCIADRVRRVALEGIFGENLPSPADPDLQVRRCASLEELAWRGVELISPGRALEPLLAQWLAGSGLHPPKIESPGDPEAAPALFAGLEKQRILCFTRVGPWGTEAVNERLHGLFCKEFSLPRAQRFVAGEPVMVTRNDYVRNIFNGDMGIVISLPVANQGRVPHVAFPRFGEAPLVLPLAHVEHNLEHGFAITTHKSQGSEFQGVLLLLPPEVGSASRELLYTALTRARRSVVLAGEPEVFLRVAAASLQRPNFLQGFLR